MNTNIQGDFQICISVPFMLFVDNWVEDVLSLWVSVIFFLVIQVSSIFINNHWTKAGALYKKQLLKFLLANSQQYSIRGVLPCLSSSLRCATSASPDDNFAESAFPVPDYASPANKWKIFYPRHKEALSPLIFGKIGDLHWNRLFSAWS